MASLTALGAAAMVAASIFRNWRNLRLSKDAVDGYNFLFLLRKKSKMRSPAQELGQKIRTIYFETSFQFQKKSVGESMNIEIHPFKRYF